MPKEEFLQSGVTAAFNKRLSEALQIDIATLYSIDNLVRPTLTTGLMKGSQGTPALVAAISAEDAAGQLRLSTTDIASLNGKELISFEDTQAGVGNTTFTATVDPGYIFWVLEIGLNVYSTTAAKTGSLKKNVGSRMLLYDKTEIHAARAVYSNTQKIAYPKPLPLYAGDSITLYSDDATTTCFAWVLGYWENV